ncbi:hypothetical protein CULC0102_1544 [Corynebacterium ulcerans 0102]|nr:hypothetical protein AFK72_07190 [Corynebacterium ulcerans]BAM27743.1 hypothetical protein CULC0102_1544 [Corynebacterium ulcerans 0102]
MVFFRGNRHWLYLASYAGANQTGSNGANTVTVLFSARFHRAPVGIDVRASITMFGLRTEQIWKNFTIQGVWNSTHQVKQQLLWLRFRRCAVKFAGDRAQKRKERKSM